MAIMLPGIIASYCSLLLPLSIGKYLEIIFASANSKTRALQLMGIQLPNSLTIFFTFFGALLVLKLLSGWLYQYQASLLGESFVYRLRLQLFQSQLQQKQASGKNNDAALLTYSNDARALQQLLVKGVIGFVKDLLFLGMTLYVLFALSVQLTIIVAASTPVFFFVYRWYNQKQKMVYANKRKRQASLLKHVSNTLLSTTDEPGDGAAKQYKRKSASLGLALKKYHLTKSLLRAIAPFMLYGMLGIIMVVIIMMPPHQKMEAGDIAAYLLLLMNCFSTIRNIIKIEYVWVQGALSAKKFYPKPQTPEIPAGPQNTVNLLAAPAILSEKN